jgi:uncharacterized membrane protein
MSPEQHYHRPFGSDKFGVAAERFARAFGTPTFIIGQTCLVVVWIVINVTAAALRWDPYPFILLNLAFSTQAAYAAPLILLAQTRQADREKHRDDVAATHREELAIRQQEILEIVRDAVDETTPGGLGTIASRLSSLERTHGG